MGADTEISWSDHTLNFWIGCMKVGVGCDHCYAETWAERWPKTRHLWGEGAKRQRTQPGNWLQADKWNAAVTDPSRPALVFTNSLSDFWDKEADHEWRVEAVDLMWRTPRLFWLILTKRPQQILKLLPGRGLPANVMLGLSAATQKELDRDAPVMAAAASRLGLQWFVSLEPLVEQVDPEAALRLGCAWVISGFESGTGARCGNPDWQRLIRDVCATWGVPYHFKQWGEWGAVPPLKTDTVDGIVTRQRTFAEAAQWADGRPWIPLTNGEVMIKAGKKRTGHKLDGVEHLAFPAIFNRARNQEPPKP